MILVFGNINTHIYLDVEQYSSFDHRTLDAQNSMFELSGSAAIHAVSAARAGAKVSLIGSIGNDILGQHCLETLRKEGINTSGISKNDMETGLEISLHQPDGDRIHALSKGANTESHGSQIPEIHLNERSLTLLSSNTDEDTLFSILKNTQARNGRSVLCLENNTKISNDVMMLADIVIGNERTVKQTKNRYIIMTENLGIGGAHVYPQNGDAYNVDVKGTLNVKNTKACFDVFCGFFAACVQAGLPVNRSVSFASRAARASTQNLGIYNAIPHLGYVEDLERNAPKSQSYLQ